MNAGEAEETEHWRRLLVECLKINTNAAGQTGVLREKILEAIASAPEPQKSQIPLVLIGFKSKTLSPLRLRLFKILYPDRPVPEKWAWVQEPPEGEGRRGQVP